MSDLNLVLIPNPVLTQVAQEATDLESLKEILPEMVKLAVQNNLVGLAGNQVGLLQRIFIMRYGEGFIPVINPKIIPDKNKGEKWGWESCGSIPKTACLVKRWAKIELEFTSLDGNITSLTLTGDDAIVAQHEQNHLNGILITSKARQRKILQ